MRSNRRIPRKHKKEGFLARVEDSGIATRYEYEKLDIDNNRRMNLIDYLLLHGFILAKSTAALSMSVSCYKRDGWGEAWLLGDSVMYWVAERPHPFLVSTLTF
jgi:hypothetical protein